jgi:hypothetical protein
MKLEDLVISFEDAKKIKELGIMQESLFYWVEYKDGEGNIHNCLSLNENNFRQLFFFRERENYIDKTISEEALNVGCGCCSDWGIVNNKYSAFTSTELGELLNTIVQCT